MLKDIEKNRHVKPLSSSPSLSQSSNSFFSSSRKDTPSKNSSAVSLDKIYSPAVRFMAFITRTPIDDAKLGYQREKPKQLTDEQFNSVNNLIKNLEMECQLPGFHHVELKRVKIHFLENFLENLKEHPEKTLDSHLDLIKSNNNYKLATLGVLSHRVKDLFEKELPRLIEKTNAQVGDVKHKL